MSSAQSLTSLRVDHIPAHTIVLEQADFFRALLSDRWQQQREGCGRRVLRLTPGPSHADFRAFLRVMYTHDTQAALGGVRDALAILHLSLMYLYHRAVQPCCAYLVQRAAHPDPPPDGAGLAEQVQQLHRLITCPTASSSPSSSSSAAATGTTQTDEAVSSLPELLASLGRVYPQVAAELQVPPLRFPTRVLEEMMVETTLCRRLNHHPLIAAALARNAADGRGSRSARAVRAAIVRVATAAASSASSATDDAADPGATTTATATVTETVRVTRTPRHHLTAITAVSTATTLVLVSPREGGGGSTRVHLELPEEAEAEDVGWCAHLTRWIELLPAAESLRCLRLLYSVVARSRALRPVALPADLVTELLGRAAVAGPTHARLSRLHARLATRNRASLALLARSLALVLQAVRAANDTAHRLQHTVLDQGLREVDHSAAHLRGRLLTRRRTRSRECASVRRDMHTRLSRICATVTDDLLRIPGPVEALQDAAHLYATIARTVFATQESWGVEAAVAAARQAVRSAHPTAHRIVQSFCHHAPRTVSDAIHLTDKATRVAADMVCECLPILRTFEHPAHTMLTAAVQRALHLSESRLVRFLTSPVLQRVAPRLDYKMHMQTYSSLDLEGECALVPSPPESAPPSQLLEAERAVETFVSEGRARVLQMAQDVWKRAVDTLLRDLASVFGDTLQHAKSSNDCVSLEDPLTDPVIDHLIQQILENLPKAPPTAWFFQNTRGTLECETQESDLCRNELADVFLHSRMNATGNADAHTTEALPSRLCRDELILRLVRCGFRLGPNTLAILARLQGRVVSPGDDTVFAGQAMPHGSNISVSLDPLAQALA